MLIAIGMYLILVALVLVWIMYRDHMSGYCDLLSVRNIAIAGFILFQCTSGTMSLFLNNWGPYLLNRPEWTALEYAAMVTVFLPLSFWAYHHGWVVKKLAQKLPSTYTVPNDSGMLAMSLLVLLLAAALRLGAMRFYLIGFVAGDVAIGLAAVSAGMAGWVWAKRFFNPAVAVISLSLTLADMVIVMAGAFGRRGLVAVGAGLIWGMYFSQWRYLPPKVFLKRLVLVSIVPVLIIAAFTSVRDSANHERSAGEQLSAMLRGGSLAKGLIDLAGGQECAAGSMWLIESHKSGGGFEHRWFLTPWFFLVYPVPRALWPDKPIPIGMLMPAMAHMQNVQRDKLNIGPGIIGNAGCEGGWIALVVYAILGGLFLRFFDEAVRLSNYSPFVVLPLGSALGHILGLARGEASGFAALTVITVGGALFTMLIVGKLIESATGSKFAPEPDEEFDDDLPEDDGELPYPEYGQLARKYSRGDSGEGRGGFADPGLAPRSPEAT